MMMRKPKRNLDDLNHKKVKVDFLGHTELGSIYVPLGTSKEEMFLLRFLKKRSIFNFFQFFNIFVKYI